MNEEQGIILRENAKAELMQIKDIESGVKYLNKVKSIETWVKAEKKDAELQNLIAEQKLRTQRILGGLLAEEDLSKGSLLRGKALSPRENDSKRLDDIGITKSQSSNFQAIASIPERTFEKFIKEKKEAVNNAVAELTTTGAVRLAKSLKDKKDSADTEQEINHRLDRERLIRETAIELKKKFNKEEIQILIKQLTK